MSASEAVTAEAIPSSTALALERTRLAFERTMMAWVRTAVSLISFGFSIYKFFDAFNKEFAKVQTASTSLIDPRRFAIIMISIGLLALVGAVMEHRLQTRALRAAGTQRLSLATVLAAFVAVAGAMALAAVLLHE